MLSYQHGYHAGNFADVVKHNVLTRLLAYLKHKEKAFLYLETHAGKGQYDLTDKQAEKTQESKQGIKLLWAEKNQLPAVFNDYIQTIKLLNNGNHLKYYPGSPFLAIHALRAQDRAFLCERHPAEYEALSKMAHFNKKVYAKECDGITSMMALLPPPEKRALIFIDPSFERKEEYKEIPAAIKKVYSKFSTGVYCLWYPVVKRHATEQLIRGMSEIKSNTSLQIEFNLTLAEKEGMSGCGLWIINPPYTLAAEVKIILDTLKTFFNPGISSYLVKGL